MKKTRKKTLLNFRPTHILVINGDDQPIEAEVWAMRPDAIFFYRKIGAASEKKILNTFVLKSDIQSIEPIHTAGVEHHETRT